jgi:hypothetical protein
MEALKQIQHFQLTYDSPYVNALNITKHLPSFSALISLTVNANYSDLELEFNNELAMIYFRQHCPFLQRLYLHGHVFERELEIMDNVCMFHFPSLIYIHVGKLHFIWAIQLLDQCPQLRSFSAKLYGHQMEGSTTASSILLPTRISMGLTAMQKLSLGVDVDFRNDFGSTFLELLLPCCHNLRTFSFDFVSYRRERRPLDPDWWTRVFASNNKLKRISLQLCVWGVRNDLSEEAVQRFKLLPFFAQLKVNVTYTIHRGEFPHMAHIYSIKN